VKAQRQQSSRTETYCTNLTHTDIPDQCNCIECTAALYDSQWKTSYAESSKHTDAIGAAFGITSTTASCVSASSSFEAVPSIRPMGVSCPIRRTSLNGFVYTA
ncbi:hypothetical protein X801_10174, partial [Opisthorchis viverrini]